MELSEVDREVIKEIAITHHMTHASWSFLADVVEYGRKTAPPKPWLKELFQLLEGICGFGLKYEYERDGKRVLDLIRDFEKEGR